MKRVSAFLLAILAVLTMASCGKEKAEKYCYNCGEGILKKDSYCSACGTLVKNIGEPETEVSTTETVTETTTVTVVTTEAVTEHKHSYSAKVTPATCSKKGFTVYTCSCGESYKDNYTEPSHNYINYVCTRCDAVDRSYAYGLIAECVKKNGKKEDGNTYYLPFAPETTPSKKFRIYYNSENDQLYTVFYSYNDDGSLESTLKVYFTLEGDYNYEYVFVDAIEMTGSVDVGTFKKGDPLKYDSYEGKDKNKEIATKLASTGLSITLEFIDMTSDLFKLGLELKDFGFAAYQQ